MAFNKFWILLVLVLLYFLFFQNCFMCALVNLSHDKKKLLLLTENDNEANSEKKLVFIVFK